MAEGNRASFKSLSLEPLASGVYYVRWIPDADVGLFSINAGIIDLGDRALVFDTLAAPQMACDLRAAVEHLTGRTADCVVNSHYHWDHIWGNQVFLSDTQIVSTIETRNRLAANGYEMINQFAAKIPHEQRTSEMELTVVRDDRRRRELIGWRLILRQVSEALPSLRLRLADLTFQQRIFFHGSCRTAEVISCGRGHSASDTILFLPEDRIAFVGDLIGVGCHPSFGDGDVRDWLRILDGLVALDPQTVVPAHGPAGTTDDVELARHYIEDVARITAAMLERGESLERVREVPIPPPFDTWELPSLFTYNLGVMYERLSQR